MHLYLLYMRMEEKFHPKAGLGVGDRDGSETGDGRGSVDLVVEGTGEVDVEKTSLVGKGRVSVVDPNQSENGGDSGDPVLPSPLGPGS